MHDDAEFLGLAPGAEPGRFQVDVVDRLTRLDGQLYGGAAIALSVAAAETVSERPALWMTTQYVSTVAVGDRLDVHAEVLAAADRTVALTPDASPPPAPAGHTASHTTTEG